MLSKIRICIHLLDSLIINGRYTMKTVKAYLGPDAIINVLTYLDQSNNIFKDNKSYVQRAKHIPEQLFYNSSNTKKKKFI